MSLLVTHCDYLYTKLYWTAVGINPCLCSFCQTLCVSEEKWWRDCSECWLTNVCVSIYSNLIQETVPVHFHEDQPLTESTHTADFTTCPTSVPGCQDRALPVQRPDSPSTSSNCLCGELPTFPSNYLTPPLPPSLLLARGSCFVEPQFRDSCRCTVLGFGRGRTLDTVTFLNPLLTLLSSSAEMTHHPQTHTHTWTQQSSQPSGRGNSSSKAICCPPCCYGNWADMNSQLKCFPLFVQRESFCLL